MFWSVPKPPCRILRGSSEDEPYEHSPPPQSTGLLAALVVFFWCFHILELIFIICVFIYLFLHLSSGNYINYFFIHYLKCRVDQEPYRLPLRECDLCENQPGRVDKVYCLKGRGTVLNYLNYLHNVLCDLNFREKTDCLTFAIAYYNELKVTFVPK